MSSGFGKWYEEKKNEENGDSSEGASWLPAAMAVNVNADQLLPLFNAENLQPINFGAMKQAMENQMPKKILGMGYQQRFKVFCALLFLAVLFFALAFFVGVPVMAARPQKFALSFTMGSLTFMGSFGILKGPVEHMQSMLQPDRLWFTALYISSMLATLYCTFHFGGASGYLLVTAASGVQLIALVWYLISFLPGGTSGLRYVLAAMGHILQPLLASCAQFQALCCARCVGWMMATRGAMT